MITATEKSPKGITKKSMGQNNVKFGWVFAKSLPNNIDSHKAKIASKPVNHSMSFVIFIIFSSNVFNFTRKKITRNKNFWQVCFVFILDRVTREKWTYMFKKFAIFWLFFMITALSTGRYFVGTIENIESRSCVCTENAIRCQDSLFERNTYSWKRIILQ